MFIRLHFFILCLFICASASHGQDKWCDIDKRFETINATGKYDDFLREVRSHLKKSAIRTRSEKWFQIAVHVVSQEPQSVSYAQIIQQIDVLNNDFAKKGANILKLNDEFTALAADTDIRFCLATVDPAGNPTNGITYTLTDKNNIALERDDINGRYVVYYDQLGGKTGWDPTRYINIWLAEYGNGILGYGSMPGTAPYPEEIGLVMDPANFGSIGNASSSHFYNRGHTLTHEMGHFFGLLHIWGDQDNSCTDSDQVEDTPNASGPYLGCPSGWQESCGISNMYQNFMDLTDDRCLAAFTHGQAMRMQASIDLYYPGLASNGPCQNVIQPFDRWWNELVWAYDAHSGQYIMYHSNGYSGNVEIEIYSIDGKHIISHSIMGQQSYLINLNGVQPGIYFVRVFDPGTGDYKVKKIPVYL